MADGGRYSGSGLSESAARALLAAEGPNALPTAARPGILVIALRVVREPMFMLLVAAAGIYLVLGDLEEALVLAASVVVVMAITVVQERRTERALEALRDLASPRALVVRDGIPRRIPGREVVRGDVVLLAEGDRVPADARLTEAHALSVDESLLTGESVAVAKQPMAAVPHVSHVYSGTLVVSGQARALVTATGPNTELGRIGASLAAIEGEKTALERETARMVRIAAALGLAFCALVGALYFFVRGDLLGGILAGLTVAMAVLPEEFPVVLTVFLALGAWRISHHNVLTRRMPAIETLGSATVLCTDKTGTLTENRMAVCSLWVDGAWAPPAKWGPEHAPLLATAAFASSLEPFDPMERAILEAAGRVAAGSLAERKPASLEKRYPLSDDFLAVCHGWRAPASARWLALKGAPETVLAHCVLADGERARALAAVGEAAARGHRLLAVARAPAATHGWPEHPRDHDFEFLGFVALADPLRPSVPGAVALCRRAGIRVVMITGDHPETARAIAREAGIDAAEVLTGKQVATMDPEALARAVRTTGVFARVRPEQKLALVAAYRAAGEVVAMTGDGVNDAPALKAADIGVAMGRRGTDVAREAAALVLLEDDFSSIVATVRLGRRIYDNIRSAMRYLVAVHVPTAGMAFLPLVMGWPLLLYPVHIVFLEFVVDPACSIAFEAERSDPRSMQRPPRPPGERMFSAAMLAESFLLGCTVLAAVAIVYAWALGSGHVEGEARAIAFAAIVFGNLALILANRSRDLTLLESVGRGNAALWWIVAAALAALAAVNYVPPAARIFGFAPIGPADLGVALAAALVGVGWFEALKLGRRRAAQAPGADPRR